MPERKKPQEFPNIPDKARMNLWVDVGEGNRVPFGMIFDAVDMEVGSQPYISQGMSQKDIDSRINSTNSPNWVNLPQAYTEIGRIDESTWKVRVGEYQQTFTKASLIWCLNDALEKAHSQEQF